MTRENVLFLCTHNSARSQMAEGLLRHLGGAGSRFNSAGTEATFVRPLAVRAMAELGIDVSKRESKTLDGYLGEPFDCVTTVCDDANEACPVFPNAKQRLHCFFEDPSQVTGSEEERLEVFRSARDNILDRIMISFRKETNSSLLARRNAWSRVAFLHELLSRALGAGATFPIAKHGP
jgi:arsenate reductase (thioredoxin)